MAQQTQLSIELSDNALTVLERRYLVRDEEGQPLETPADMFARVAGNIAQADRYYGATETEVETRTDEFLELMLSRDFMPNSPTLMNAGRPFQQLSACFVLPVDDSMESIFDAVKNTALIHKSGGGTGFSFSRLRPKDDVVSSTKGVSSGPVSFMTVFDSATEAIKQGGTRRGANMAVLRIDHPDILEFIECKAQRQGRLHNFNISVAVTDDFMLAARAGHEYDLINPRNGRPSGRLNAREVWSKLIQSAWACGDPGIIFIDRVNRDNPTPHVGWIESTNPCGEQPLLPYESCNLGSINLAQMTRGRPTEATLDWEHLGDVVRRSVRFLDNVIDMNSFPLPQIAEMTRANRKIGLGVMGFAELLIKMGVPYDSDQAVAVAEDVMKFIRQEARAESERLADERGVFPNWPGSIFNGSEGRRLRHATTTTIAPTGTISIIAGTSSGIEPLFAVAFTRHVMDRDELVEVNDLFEEIALSCGFHTPELMKEIAAHGTVRNLPTVPSETRRLFATAHDIDPTWHVRIQSAFQKYTDNAVSKTVNFPRDASVQDVANVYELAYDLGCKGITIFRDGCLDQQVLTLGSGQKQPAETGPVRLKPRARPDVVQGQTRAVTTGCGKLYVTINSDPHGPFEVFAQMGKAGGCAASQSEGLARLASLALRSGVDPEQIIKQLKGISCHLPGWEKGGGKILSCPDAIAKTIERAISPDGEQLTIDFGETQNGGAGACPECGGAMEPEGGCLVCRDCAYSQCG
ncbi:MAG: vitamin B12-dependent ribonucleotide reductase [Armatimonadetes bacterium]|nr:vitamin B12-dependent ribonucleotide reductase [Armatimonadota bacterium]